MSVPNEFESIGRMPKERREELLQYLTDIQDVPTPPIEDVEVEENEDATTEHLNWIQRREAREFVPEHKEAIMERIRDTQFSDLDSFLVEMSTRRSDESLKALESSTQTLVSSMCEVDDSGELRMRSGMNGLVVGEVQAGKTTSMEALAAAATSLGSRVVVVLAGVTDKLRNQTQERFEEQLARDSDRYWSPTSEHDLITYRPGVKTSEQVWHPMRAVCRKHLRSSEDNVLLIVTKKNVSTLEATHTLLEQLDKRGDMGEAPILILDDECDHASLNTISDLFDGITHLHGTAVHKGVVNIRTSFNSVYWGYTATPQAQCLGMSPDDALYPDVPHVLDSHDYYLGPLEVFDRLRERAVDPCMIGDIVLPRNGDDRVAYLQQMQAPPGSMIEAMINHGLSGALHHLHRREFMPHGSSHSMLVHICREILGQDEVKRLADIARTRAMRELRSSLKRAVPLVDNAISRFMNNRIELRSGNATFPDKEELLWKAIEVLETSEMRLLNSESEDKLDYDSDDCPDNMIVIGGDILSRGLSVHGLRTTYYLREPASAVIDTTLQTARWFGPLREDKDMISIHMTKALADRFQKIAWDNAQIRDELRRVNEEGLSLADAKISYHPGYQLTNKRRHGQVLRRAGDRISVSCPVISTDDSAIQSLRGGFEMLEDSKSHQLLEKVQPRLKKNTIQGAIWRVTLVELQAFLEMQEWSRKSSQDRDDMLERIRAMRSELGDGHPVNIVLRNGSARSMDKELPSALQGLGLNRVIRGSKDGGRSIDQVASGRTPGQSIFTSDWWIDGAYPSGPTSQRRGWRSTRDPVLLVVYVVDEHPDRRKRLRGAGPWVCFAAQFPHSGPGGSVMVNRHGRGL